MSKKNGQEQKKRFQNIPTHRSHKKICFHLYCTFSYWNKQRSDKWLFSWLDRIEENISNYLSDSKDWIVIEWLSEICCLYFDWDWHEILMMNEYKFSILYLKLSNRIHKNSQWAFRGPPILVFNSNRSFLHQIWRWHFLCRDQRIFKPNGLFVSFLCSKKEQETRGAWRGKDPPKNIFSRSFKNKSFWG